MKKLFLKLFLISIPILLVIALYLWSDPFMVLYHYDHFHERDGVAHVTLNNEYSNVEMFKKNYTTYKYDAFIFGSSRSRNFRVAEWQKHIPSRACFHFDASNESLYGVERKVAYLHGRGVAIKYALVVIDAELLAVTENKEGHVYRKHPDLSGENRLDFQLSFFKDFLNKDFIFAYSKFLYTGKVTDEMTKKLLLQNVEYHYEEDINEESFPKIEAQIGRVRDSFYGPRMGVFYQRPAQQVIDTPVIKKEQLKMLKSMKAAFNKDNTSYRIVINPLYNQKKLNPADLIVLQNIFGADKVFDFSGVNDITNDLYNYYETSHYRPHIATRIMDSVYGHHSAIAK